jgi:pantothenate kinase-related protein Tda10
MVRLPSVSARVKPLATTKSFQNWIGLVWPDVCREHLDQETIGKGVRVLLEIFDGDGFPERHDVQLHQLLLDEIKPTSRELYLLLQDVHIPEQDKSLIFPAIP